MCVCEKSSPPTRVSRNPDVCVCVQRREDVSRASKGEKVHAKRTIRVMCNAYD